MGESVPGSVLSRMRDPQLRTPKRMRTRLLQQVAPLSPHSRNVATSALSSPRHLLFPCPCPLPYLPCPHIWPSLPPPGTWSTHRPPHRGTLWLPPPQLLSPQKVSLHRDRTFLRPRPLANLPPSPPCGIPLNLGTLKCIGLMGTILPLGHSNYVLSFFLILYLCAPEARYQATIARYHTKLPNR